MKPDTVNFYSTLQNEYALLSIQGPDAKAFLQGQVTCDVAQVNNHQSRIGAICNPKGRALTTFRLVALDAGYLMILPGELIESITNRLRMYVLRAKVSLDIVTDDWQIIGLSGDACRALIPDSAPFSADDRLTTEETLAICLPSPQQRWLWLEPTPASTASKKLKDYQEAPVELWQRAMIEDGVPRLSTSTQELFVPQMLNLDLLDGISFNKGCYTGQEIVARMHYLGKLKKRLYCFRFPHFVEPTTRLFCQSDSQNSAGTVVNCAPDPDHGYLLLAVCQINIATDDLLFPENSSTFTESVPLPYELSGAG